MFCERGLYVEPLESNIYSPELLERLRNQEANIRLIKYRHFLHLRTHFLKCVCSYKTNTFAMECVLLDGYFKEEN